MEKLFSLPVAHRGLHGEIPENSKSAFRAAIKAGYAIETDVRLSKDGALVLFHDDNLFRMTGDRRNVIDCTLKELLSLSLKGTEEKIPLLKDFLEEIGGQVPILLEIKNVPKVNPKEFCARISEAFEGYSGEFAVQSFQPLYVKNFKKLRPDIPCGLLTLSHPDLKDFASPFARLKRHIVSHMSLNFWIKPDFVSFEFHSPTKKIKKFEGQKFCWTVRSPEDESAARMFCDNIIFEGYRPEVATKCSENT